ncbi:hypothetical protein ACGFI9_11440 [Micromonospora sp. NPDC048930]|uniref:hypothetical protein n=1 Tax=Micromonospora sp. NPDC048930 TaxID=3364261 RepID=UPI00371751A8
MSPNGEPLRNPFDIKELGPAAEGALQPWGYPEHEKLYLAVDQTQQAYERFIDFLPPMRRDGKHPGRLVVVTGERGSGKTSLIHRCVHRLQQALADTTLKIVDVTRYEPFSPPAPEGRSVLENYFDRLAHRVLTEVHAEDDNYPDPGATIMPAPSAYARLSGHLRSRKEFAAIILPAFLDQVNSPGQEGELALARVHPVQHYMGFRVERVFFFLESRNPEAVRSWHRQLDGDGKAEAIVLSLGPLKDHDGWTYAGGRLARTPNPGWPTVDRQMMENLVPADRRMTLSALRELCHDVWRQAIADGDATVTDKHISKFHERQAESFEERRPYLPDDNPGTEGPEAPPTEGPPPEAPHRPGTDEDESGDETDAK